MLQSAQRMRKSPEFRTTVQEGIKASGRTVVVHVRPAGPGEPGPSRVGFVVSKRVGNAVTRNRVKRRLRHLIGPLLECSPMVNAVVVRALPAAANEPKRLPMDLANTYHRAIARL